MNLEIAKQIAAVNDEILRLSDYATGNEPTVAFEHGGVMITDPFLDSSSRFEVDPLETYGQAFLESPFVVNPEAALDQAKTQLHDLRIKMGGTRESAQQIVNRLINEEAAMRMATPSGAKLFGSDPRRTGRNPSLNLVTYSNPAQTRDVIATRDEIEDFERDSGMSTDSADVQAQEYFDALVTYLRDNYELREL